MSFDTGLRGRIWRVDSDEWLEIVSAAVRGTPEQNASLARGSMLEDVNTAYQQRVLKPQAER